MKEQGILRAEQRRIELDYLVDTRLRAYLAAELALHRERVLQCSGFFVDNHAVAAEERTQRKIHVVKQGRRRHGVSEFATHGIEGASRAEGGTEFAQVLADLSLIAPVERGVRFFRINSRSHRKVTADHADAQIGKTGDDLLDAAGLQELTNVS